MLIKCAWCGVDMGKKEPYRHNVITHGICNKCMAVELQRAGIKKSPTSSNCSGLKI